MTSGSNITGLEGIDLESLAGSNAFRSATHPDSVAVLPLLSSDAQRRSPYTFDPLALTEVVNAFGGTPTNLSDPAIKKLHIVASMEDEKAASYTQRSTNIGEGPAEVHHISILPAVKSVRHHQDLHDVSLIKATNLKAIEQVGKLISQLNEDPAIARKRDERYRSRILWRSSAKLGALAITEIASLIPTIEHPSSMVLVLPSSWLIGAVVVRDIVNGVRSQERMRQEEIANARDRLFTLVKPRAKDLAEHLNLVVPRQDITL